MNILSIFSYEYNKIGLKLVLYTYLEIFVELIYYEDMPEGSLETTGCVVVSGIILRKEVRISKLVSPGKLQAYENIRAWAGEVSRSEGRLSPGDGHIRFDYRPGV